MSSTSPASATAVAADASVLACMKGERIRVFRPYYEGCLSSLERREEGPLTLVKLTSLKLVPPLSVGEALLMEGHGLRCDCSVDSIQDLSREEILIGVLAPDCQVRPCSACGSLGLPLSNPPFPESLVGKAMRFSRPDPKNVTEAMIEKVERRESAFLSIVHLENLATPIPLSIGDLLVLESLNGQLQWEADVKFHGDSEFFEGCNESSSVMVYVRDAQANKGPKLLPQKYMGIFVQPTDNGMGPAFQREKNIAEPKIKIGINGFGNIGRTMARIALESDDVELVAINDASITMDQMTCMFRDTHDQWLRNDFKMKDPDTLVFGEKEVTIFRIKEPDKIPWNKASAEYIVAAYVDQNNADYYKTHISKYKHYIDTSSNDIFKPHLSPLAKILHERFGMVQGVITTCRAPVLFIVPQNSNAAKAIGEVLPHWKGMLSGLIFRVPAVHAPPIDLAIELAPYKEYGLILSNIKPSFGFCTLLAWCVEMIRQIPEVSYCQMNYGVNRIG